MTLKYSGMHPNLMSQFIRSIISSSRSPTASEGLDKNHMALSSEKSKGFVSSTSSYPSKVADVGCYTGVTLRPGLFYHRTSNTGNLVLVQESSSIITPPLSLYVPLHTVWGGGALQTSQYCVNPSLGSPCPPPLRLPSPPWTCPQNLHTLPCICGFLSPRGSYFEISYSGSLSTSGRSTSLW